MTETLNEQTTWCVHIHGCDDILPATSRGDAILRAHRFNSAMVESHLKDYDENGYFPSIWAVPAMRKDVQAKPNQPAAGAPKNWPHGYLQCGCCDDGSGRHVR